VKYAMKYKVAVANVSHSREDLEDGIKRVLDLIDWKDWVRRGETIVIKPNMGNLTYITGVITTPLLIYYLVLALRDRVSEVIVGESDGIRYSCDEAFVRTGIKKAAEEAGGRVINFSKDKLVEVTINGLYLKKIKLPKTLLEAGTLITVPLIKTHEVTTVTCALKNQLGCIPDKYRILYHHHLDEVIVDINKTLSPKLAVTDGLVCMEGSGPIHGPLRELNLIFAANNPVANDVVISSKVMGVDPKSIRHLSLAAKEKLGPIDAKLVECIGDFEGITSNFALPSLDIVSRTMLKSYKSKSLTWLFYVSPLFNLLNSLAWTYRGFSGKKRRVIF